MVFCNYYIPTYTVDVDVVTILILIDGFLQSQVRGHEDTILDLSQSLF